MSMIIFIYIKHKIHICYLFVILTTLFTVDAYGKPEFAPWKKDAAAGDAVITHHKVAASITKIRGQFKRTSIPQNRSGKSNGVHNGPQGGGFFLIRFFQVVISPQDGPACRYTPTCSEYAKQAVQKHGILLGSILAGDRLLRCNPYLKPGHDPVPEKIAGD